MAENQVVLGVFADEAAADAAVESLKAWDKASDEVKLTSIGVLVLDDKGALKTHKMGSRSKAKGAGIGSSWRSWRPRRCWLAWSAAGSLAPSITRVWA